MILDGRTKGLAAGTPAREGRPPLSRPTGGSPRSALRVGDMIGCAISHPCTTFDKWRFLPIVDAVLTCF